MLSTEAPVGQGIEQPCVGPLPPELQDPEHSTWTAGAATKATDLGAAKGFTKFLASPESLGVFKSKGFAPP
jgi:hypothetical protein